MSGTTIDWEQLRAAAARAAGLLRNGETIGAANVENASYVAGICAETALVGVLVSTGAGRGDLVAVAVTDPEGNDLAPCGRCRQLLHEMGGADLPVNERPMRELLPDAFGPEDLA